MIALLITDVLQFQNTGFIFMSLDCPLVIIYCVSVPVLVSQCTP